MKFEETKEIKISISYVFVWRSCRSITQINNIYGWMDQLYNVKDNWYYRNFIRSISCCRLARTITFCKRGAQRSL